MKGFGGGGLPGNLQGIMKQAQKMQEQMRQVQEDASKAVFEGSAGGGAVKATANGKFELVSVAISRDAVNPDDVDMLQDMVLVACNDALSKAQENLKTEMGKVTGGMNIPGF